jgi:sulfoacetaldehyde dehydrogenase
VERPSIPLSQALMAGCDLRIATGGPPMVRAPTVQGSPRTASGDRQRDDGDRRDGGIKEAATNTRISKTNDHGSGLLGGRQPGVDASVYDAILRSWSGRAGTS